MLTHMQVWRGVDRLAARAGMTPSGLARAAGLDPTTFNPSKRTSDRGTRPRWPSTESVSKILKATGMSIAEFMGLLGDGERPAPRSEPRFRQVPLLGLAQAGAGGFFDDGGFPAGHGWDQVDVPVARKDGAYALKVTGDSMLPLYRDGDTIIVSPAEPCRRGDRVVVKTREGEVMAKVLVRHDASGIESESLNPAHPPRQFAASEIEWIARIVWASQ